MSLSGESGQRGLFFATFCEPITIFTTKKLRNRARILMVVSVPKLPVWANSVQPHRRGARPARVHTHTHTPNHGPRPLCVQSSLAVGRRYPPPVAYQHSPVSDVRAISQDPWALPVPPSPLLFPPPRPIPSNNKPTTNAKPKQVNSSLLTRAAPLPRRRVPFPPAVRGRLRLRSAGPGGSKQSPLPSGQRQPLRPPFIGQRRHTHPELSSAFLLFSIYMF